ncbi:tRNA (adenosine(37)-N6)-threonylcarbamoyltransferase complex dimerization subunit type 1 TsaB [Diplocloster agilis]|uniref:tRNA (adenosine(37)-N6)-threonylcarbamoyltransferase complex dimerization subunit type 1 TsaB n=1 Tax=Diplocloster agilis TaxID=2850323 RepID=UPI0008218300|nr:tRNA (adenosine(37)-N6)-threonylcarbamoyltransferase complex dimerization subunit type 1 TsaB [Suonthocola fibrivorans]MCU6736642.1 tRNA (adenosine(37)-N6)-threonylcarbamoyltransferase complex dimerization subunit type 1 TsaB [Suonthocola fibrivorans]SCJ92485.1 UGMP family protein [uncultured Clostridium sp.]
MKILALDSSGLVATVAVVEDDNLLAEYTVHYKKTHSQTLLPMLDTIASMIELDLDSIDAIAVAKGPGSFTGLRIGSATAKGLGLALNKPLIGIPTVDGLAYNLYGTDKLICPLMDARRSQVYTGIYEFVKEEFHVLDAQMAVPIEEIAHRLNGYGREVIFLGDGVPVFSERLAELMQVPYTFAPAHMNKQRASAVAVLALSYAKAGKTETAEAHMPDYLRPSQAEREREEREKAGKC